jgi:excisionase family DNA binding protein
VTPDEARQRATLTVPEAGQLLGIGRNQAYAAARAGQLPVLQLGGRLLVPTARLFAELLGDTAPDMRTAEPASPAVATTRPREDTPDVYADHATVHAVPTPGYRGHHAG